MESEGSGRRKERAMLLSRINSEAENTQSKRNVGIRLQQEEINRHRTLWSKPQTKRNDFLFPLTGEPFLLMSEEQSNALGEGHTSLLSRKKLDLKSIPKQMREVQGMGYGALA